MEKVYLPRMIDKLLKERLEAVGAVLIAGPKWCGKTTTAEQQANKKTAFQPFIFCKMYKTLFDAFLML